jgi:hypothetical protein
MDAQLPLVSGEAVLMGWDTQLSLAVVRNIIDAQISLAGTGIFEMDAQLLLAAAEAP